MKTYHNVNEYIQSQPSTVQPKLRAIRKVIKQTAPQAQEKISYGIPYYSLNGQLIYFAAFKNHIGLYPMKSAIKVFEKELKEYETSAGTIRLPLDKPLPLSLIKLIVVYRVEQSQNKN